MIPIGSEARYRTTFDGKREYYHDAFTCPRWAKEEKKNGNQTKKLAIVYHGTDAEAAKSIQREGFRPDSWFARHLEDAIYYGGPYVFEVALVDELMPDNWQFHVDRRVSPNAIVRFSVFRHRALRENDRLRCQVMRSNQSSYEREKLAQDIRDNPGGYSEAERLVWGSV